MSEINLDLTVSNTQATFVVESTELAFTTEPISLNLMNGASPVANGFNYSVQYNLDGVITGDAEFTYVVPFETLHVPNISISGGSTLGNVANLHIGGGTNGYVLQTDGAGNLSWTAQTGGGGNGTPGGSNTQIQFNDAGTFGGNSGFTFNSVTGNVNIPGNLSIVGNISGSILSANYANYAGIVVNSSQSNITSLGTLTSLNVSGTTTIQQAKEKVTLSSSPATGTVNFDVLTQAILYNTANASSNFTLNIRGNSSTSLDSIMSSGQSVTVTFLNTNGAIGYYANIIQIDGSTVSPKWVVNGTPTSGTNNGNDTYTFNIIKTASSTYTVLGSQIGFV